MANLSPDLYPARTLHFRLWFFVRQLADADLPDLPRDFVRPLACQLSGLHLTTESVSMLAARDEPIPRLADQISRLAADLGELKIEIGKVAQLKPSIDEVLDRLRGTAKSHYSIAEVARLVDRSEYRVREWVREGLSAAVRVDGTGPRGRLLIPREELERVIRGGRGGSLPAAVTRPNKAE